MFVLINLLLFSGIVLLIFRSTQFSNKKFLRWYGSAILLLLVLLGLVCLVMYALSHNPSSVT
ncbi:MAG: hypothetical protein FGM61_05280 [Sediminibacterium sp.]|nr:hypothetical protein [Sediminibacterium sp.]